MSTTLTQAFTQWASRPVDERFTSLQGLHDSVQARRNRAATALRPWSDLHVSPAAEGSGLLLNGKARAASLNNWSFGQLCNKLGAPAGFVSQLKPATAAQVLNERLSTERAEGDAALLFDRGTGDALTCRALVSPSYTRIWDADVTSRLLRLSQEHPEWQPAPAAFDGSRGLYAGDRDMFAFLVDSERRIFERDPNGGLGRGFFVWNAETGSKSFGVMTFFYEYVCGNHRVWGASGVAELRIRHVGNADERAFGELEVELRKYAEGSAAEDEAKVLRARAYQLGDSKEAVLDRVFGLRAAGLSLRTATEAYTLAEKREGWYGSPRSAWGFAGGLTELARDVENADTRVELDKAAGKVMALAF